MTRASKVGRDVLRAPTKALRAALALSLLFSASPQVHACAVCFGKSDSRLAQGMNMGIFTLLGFIVATLAALSCFFVFLALRASRHPQHDPAAPADSESPDKTVDP